MKLNVILLATATLALASAPTWAAGDAALGQKVFMKCAACHDVAKGVNKVGPTLKGVIGRKAGTVEGYSYSEPMKNSGLTWDDATIADYLKNPKAKVPGTKMAFAGLKDQAEIDNLVAYLDTQK